MKKDTKNKKDYSGLLRASVYGCMEYEGILVYLPDFYLILCNIFSDKKSNWYTKMLVNSALAYLVIEKDVISEKRGPKGYLDDLFICVYILKKIRDKISTEIILNNVYGTNINKEEILDLIYHIYTKSKEHLGEKVNKILSLVGLNKFNLFDLMYLEDKNMKLINYKKKRKLIYAMLAIKTKQVFKKLNISLKNEQLKKHIKEHPEFIEIKRFMEFDKK